ncbi:hypothetical protein ACFY7H_14930 [Streptomyces sp. NPDC012794]|uniref:hypothetical protein n=1 Tax=Streptomyces sp. NPDC012794 TaxID=3364850 RepID=UPI003680CCF1
MGTPATPLSTPSKQLITAWQGRLLTRFAGVVQHRFARHRFRPDVALRNAAMRAANRRGVDRDELVRVTRLSTATVTKALAGNSTPTATAAP